jgi:hypothetical protein
MSESDFTRYRRLLAHLEKRDLSWAQQQFGKFDAHGATDDGDPGLQLILDDGSTYPHLGVIDGECFRGLLKVIAGELAEGVERVDDRFLGGERLERALLAWTARKNVPGPVPVPVTWTCRGASSPWSS